MWISLEEPPESGHLSGGLVALPARRLFPAGYLTAGPAQMAIPYVFVVALVYIQTEGNLKKNICPNAMGFPPDTNILNTQEEDNRLLLLQRPKVIAC